MVADAEELVAMFTKVAMSVLFSTQAVLAAKKEFVAPPLPFCIDTIRSPQKVRRVRGA